MLEWRAHRAASGGPQSIAHGTVLLQDLRADRQPEFTQLDMEMAFMDQNAIIDLTEQLTAAVFREVWPRLALSLSFLCAASHHRNKSQIREREQTAALVLSHSQQVDGRMEMKLAAPLIICVTPPRADDILPF